jgi:methionyl-tRNA formyltransferase
MDPGLDTGPIAMLERLPIDPDMTAGELHDRLAPLGADLMVRVLAALETDSLQLTPQPTTGVTLAPKLTNAETRIVWRNSWQDVHNHCRGLAPVPGAWFEVVDDRGLKIRVKVLQTTKGEGSGAPGTVLDNAFNVACALGAIRVVKLQRAGRDPTGAEDFLRGFDLRGRTLQ